MDLIIFGLVVLCVWCWEQLQKCWLEIWSRDFQAENSPNLNLMTVIKSLLRQLSFPHWRLSFQFRINSMAVSDSRLRLNLLDLCTSVASQFLILLILCLFLRISALWLLGLIGILWIVSKAGRNIWKKRLHKFPVIVDMLLLLGLFLFVCENILRWSAQLRENEFVFYIADGRPQMMFLFVLIGFFLNLLFQVNSLVLILASLGLASGLMALNNGMALVVGETIGLLFVFWNQMRQSQKTNLSSYVWAGVVGSIVFMFFFGFFKSWTASYYGSEQTLDQMMAFIVWVLTHYAFVFGCQMLWGHFHYATCNVTK